MSTSRDSRIGLPLSSDSRTANSRARSCRSRAIRNRYLPRSAGRIGPQVRVKARRAATTARSTSASVPVATSDSTSSVAGLIVFSGSPEPSMNSPSTNRPYDGAMLTSERGSGAGAYVKAACAWVSVMSPSVDRHVVGTGVVAGALLLPLQQEVVEEARGTEAEPVGGEPVGAGRLVDQHQMLDGVLRGPDPSGRLHADLPVRGVAEVADRLEHHVADREGGGWGDLAGRRLDEVGAGQHGQPARPADVVERHQLAGLEDHLQVRGAGGLLDLADL